MTPTIGLYVMWPTNHLGLDDREDKMTLVQVTSVAAKTFKVRRVLTLKEVDIDFEHYWLRPSGREGALCPRVATDDEIMDGLKAMEDYLATKEQEAHLAYTRAQALNEQGARLLEHHKRKTAA